ncbi:hypothetical protein CPB86DRAFT_322951 [Serendipita vermifera]|nr:hypothetical protein CPB86DRAFT_322951 [Serendipita vermifera]
MISKYDQLIIGCKFLEVCREEASSTKAVKDMQRWHVKGTNSKNIIDMGDEDLHRFVLPETERNYRESVVRQQALARVINPWHHNQLPELLESHQSRSEEIKTLMARMVSEHSRLLTALVGHLEATKNQVHGFSSSSFISLAHIRHDYESEHEYMKEAVHVDFSNGTMRSHVIFGTVSQTPLEVRRAMNLLEGRNVDWLYQGRLDNDKGFELEQSSATLPSLQLQTLSDDELKLLCSFGLLSNPPLIPLDEEEIKRYANGISRKNLHIIMSRLAKQDEIAVPLDILHWYNVYTLPKLMTHREDSRKIVEDIYRKWDFSNHRPFPPGVTRELK